MRILLISEEEIPLLIRKIAGLKLVTIEFESTHISRLTNTLLTCIEVFRHCEVLATPTASMVVKELVDVPVRTVKLEDVSIERTYRIYIVFSNVVVKLTLAKGRWL